MQFQRTEYDDSNFYQSFCEDLKNAKSLVLIQSPFIAATRVEQLLPHLTDCVKRGVRVCCWIRRPRDSAQSSEQQQNAATNRLIDRLITSGIHVTLLADIHEKCAAIDGSILWRGSLNILSHYKSSEEMFRECDPEQVLRTLRKKRLYRCSQCERNTNSLLQVHDVFFTLGQMVKSSRKSLGLNQRELSERLKVDQRVLSLIERGERNITFETLQGICDVLLISPFFVPWFAKQSFEERLRAATGISLEHSNHAKELARVIKHRAYRKEKRVILNMKRKTKSIAATAKSAR